MALIGVLEGPLSFLGHLDYSWAEVKIRILSTYMKIQGIWVKINEIYFVKLVGLEWNHSTILLWEKLFYRGVNSEEFSEIWMNLRL